MAKPIALTAIAEQDLEHITDYLLENWGDIVCDRFLTRFEQVCGLISEAPPMFPLVYRKKKIRKCTLTRQNTIYYRELTNEVQIITIFDTRQDPKKLSTLIKEH